MGERNDKGKVIAGDELLDVSLKLGNEIDAVAESVVAAVEHSAHYGKQLEAFAGTVRQSPSLKVVNGHVGGILAETQKICERNHDLEDQLRESAAEIAALKKQLEEAHETANTDALTSLANRRMFCAQLRNCARHVKKAEESLCLLMIDVDHFKQFNDRHGHRFGDQVLKLVAHVLTENVKGAIRLPVTAARNSPLFCPIPIWPTPRVWRKLCADPSNREGSSSGDQKRRSDP